MDKAPQGSAQDQESEGNEGQGEDQLVQGLENHETGPEHDSGPAPGHADAKDTSAEKGAQGAEKPHGDHAEPANAAAPSNAVTAINDKVSKARTKMYNKGEKRRLKEQEARVKSRAGGKDWTAPAIADLIKNGGPQEVLRQIGQRKPAEAIALMKTANQWDPWIVSLGAGKLHNMAAHQLDNLVMDSIIVGPDLVKMFKVRYNIDVMDGTAAWTDDNIRTCWKQMSVLPASDVSKNTMVTIMTANSGQGGGTYSGDAATAPGGTIDMGQDIQGDTENLETTVRHEIGHGVHEQIKGQVDPWLHNEMGFVSLPDMKSFVDALGGFPATFTDSAGKSQPFTQPWKDLIVKMIDDHVGDSSWAPANASPTTGQDADSTAAYNALKPEIRNGVTQSVANWYNNYQAFQVKDGSSYFLNHWYHKPMKFSAKAKQSITATNDTYCAMSPEEFFATCYAEFFRDPTGIKNEKNWGGNLSGSVKSFFKEVVVKRQPYDKFQKSLRKKHT